MIILTTQRAMLLTDLFEYILTGELNKCSQQHYRSENKSNNLYFLERYT